MTIFRTFRSCHLWCQLTDLFFFLFFFPGNEVGEHLQSVLFKGVFSLRICVSIRDRYMGHFHFKTYYHRKKRKRKKKRKKRQTISLYIMTGTSLLSLDEKTGGRGRGEVMLNKRIKKKKKKKKKVGGMISGCTWSKPCVLTSHNQGRKEGTLNSPSLLLERFLTSARPVPHWKLEGGGGRGEC